MSVPAAAATPGADERLGELQAQNEHLQGLVDKYKRVIDDTEGVLSRLQQNVTTEETRWAQQLADKQRELDDLRTNSLHQVPLQHHLLSGYDSIFFLTSIHSKNI